MKKTLIFYILFYCSFFVLSQDYDYDMLKLIENNNISELECWILNRYMNINFKNKYGETPLIYAVRINSSNEIIKLLINNGADINAETNEITIDMYSFKKGLDNLTPFICAMLNNNLEIGKILLKKGVDINYCPRNDTTPLIEVCKRSGKIDINAINFLISNGADVNATTKRNMNLQDTALLEKLSFKYNIPRPYINTIDLYIPRSYTDESNKTALIYSVAKIYPVKEVIELLLKNGADVNIKPQSGRSALMEALIFRHKQIAIYLINNGADINVKTYGKFGRTYLADYTPLMFASGDDKMYEVVDLLIKKGVKINDQATDGETALTLAVCLDQLKNVELLLKNGADVSIKKDNKNLALSYANQKKILVYDRMKKKKNYKKIVKLLKKY
ncbi:MAG TPA: ankyrin repeat domain-containing protein, partial [Spirochaetota bacterium]|nr:ankyrin repeat domain-containing protein [Spirochaetota bacterium]